MIVIFNRDGSIYDTELADYVQQGSSGANRLCVACADSERDGLSAYLIALRPNGTSITLPAHGASFDCNGEHYRGWEVTLGGSFTLYAGTVHCTVNVVDEDETIIANYPFDVTVNATGNPITGEWDEQINVAQYNSYMAQMSGKAVIKRAESKDELPIPGQRSVLWFVGTDKYDAYAWDPESEEYRTILNGIYVVGNIATADISGLPDGQLIYDENTHTYYEKTAISPYYSKALNGTGVLGAPNILCRSDDGTRTIEQLHTIYGDSAYIVLRYLDKDYFYFSKKVGSTYTCVAFDTEGQRFYKASGLSGSALPSTMLIPANKIEIASKAWAQPLIDDIVDELTDMNAFKGVLKSWDDVELLHEYILENGTVYLSDYRITTDYIPVRPNYKVKVNDLNLNVGGDTICGVACYDKYKNFISGVGITGSTGSVSGTLTIPNNCYYIRIGTDIYETGAFETEYAKGIKKEVEELKKDETKLLSETGFIFTGWGDLGETEDGYINADGDVVQSDYRKVSDFIKTKEGLTVKANNLYLYLGDSSVVYGVACYDKDKNFMAGYGISGNTSQAVSGQFVVPAGCYYIRVSDSIDSTADFSIPQVDFTDDIVNGLPKLINPFKLNKKIAIFGDSIFAIAGQRGSGIAHYMKLYSGAQIDNFALGGTGICDIHTGWSPEFEYYDFPALIDAITSGDFTNQDAHLNDDGVPEYFAEVIAQLKTIDLTDYDIVILSYGANDYTGEMDEATIKSAIDNAVTKIYALNKNINIVFDLPHYRVWNTPDDYVDDAYTHKNGLNYTLGDVVNFFKEKLDTYGIAYIDNLKECNWNRYNMDKYFYHADGAHFLASGCKECAKRIIAFLNVVGFNVE